jgi:ribonuclease Z
MNHSAKEVVTIPAGRFTIEGCSRAGNETWFRVRELGISLDIGRCPDMLVGLSHIFITHAHLDHALGVPFYAAQRNLQSLPRGNVYLPAAALDGFQRLMRVHEELEGTRYEVNLVGVEAGETIEVSPSLKALAHRAPHRVVANAWEFLEPRHKLLAGLHELSGEEIAAMRRRGQEVESRTLQSLLFYTGDTDRSILEDGEALFQSPVLMIECSFTAPEDYGRAEQYRHLHADDLWEFADRFQNEMILLTHFSLRDSAREIHERIGRRCPARLRERVRMVLPDPFTTLSHPKNAINHPG